MKQLHDRLWIKRLIWSYFFLLIFEGALRKWVLPGAANLILVIRDPIVLAAYFLAWRSGLFPRNAFIGVAAVIALFALTAGMLAPGNTPFVALYGFRTDFLQLPFIFLIAKIFDARDVERVGYWTLVLAVPMAALMAMQFSSPSNSFINSGADDSFGQIDSAMGHIRPPGTFSFITGPVYFYSMAAAFLLYNPFGRRYPAWLVAAATLATMCAAAVAGSRSLVAGVGVVFILGLLFSSVLRPFLALRWLASLAVLAIAALFLSKLSVIQMGLTVFDQRVSNASGAEGGASGLLARVFSGFTGFYPTLFQAPLWGQGLGMGTNAGMALMVDKSKFIWFEDEWGRIIVESGPLLGGAFVLYRIALTAWIGAVAVRHAARRDPLPLLLFGAGFLSLLNGNLGQATSLGFIIWLSGLCLAATRVATERVKTARPASITAPAVATESVALVSS